MSLRDELGGLFVWDLDSRLLTWSDQIDPKGELNDLPLSVQASIEKEKIYIQMKMGRIIVYRLERGAPLKLALEEDHRSHGSLSFCHFQLFRNVLATPSSSKGATGYLDIIKTEDDLEPIIKDISSREKTGMCLCCRFVALPDAHKANEALLVAGYDSGLISVFRLILAEGRAEEIKSVQALSSTVVDLTAELRGQKLLMACGGAASQLKLISFDFNGGLLEECQGHHSVLEFEGISAVDMLDGILVSGGWDAQIRLFRAEPTFECIRIDHSHRDVINQVKLYNSLRDIQGNKRPSQRYNRLLFSASRDGSINMYNLTK